MNSNFFKKDSIASNMLNASNNSNLNFAENSDEEKSVQFDLNYHSDEEIESDEPSTSKNLLYGAKVTKKRTNKS